jgi:hypothetical protein
MTADARAKDILVVRCDLVANGDGTVVVTRAGDLPYDAAITLRLPGRSVTADRPDGVMVGLSIESLVESRPPAGVADGATLPPTLSLDQRSLIALDSRMTVLPWRSSASRHGPMSRPSHTIGIGQSTSASVGV